MTTERSHTPAPAAKSAIPDLLHFLRESIDEASDTLQGATPADGDTDTRAELYTALQHLHWAGIHTSQLGRVLNDLLADEPAEPQPDAPIPFSPTTPSPAPAEPPAGFVAPQGDALAGLDLQEARENIGRAERSILELLAMLEGEALDVLHELCGFVECARRGLETAPDASAERGGEGAVSS